MKFRDILLVSIFALLNVSASADGQVQKRPEGPFGLKRDPAPFLKLSEELPKLGGSPPSGVSPSNEEMEDLQLLNIVVTLAVNQD